MMNNKNRKYVKTGLALLLALVLTAGGVVTALAAPVSVRFGDLSGGKDGLVERVLAINSSLDADALGTLTTEELRDLIRTGAPGMPIGQQAAYDAALTYAGLTESDVALIDVDPELDEYTPYYDVELNVDGREYDYTVAAYTGEVLYGEQPSAAGTDGNTAAAKDAISEDEAAAAALSWDGLPVDSTGVTPRVKADSDDGRYHYDVTFEAGGYGYEYEIDAATGEMLSVQIEKLYTNAAGGNAAAGTAGDVTADSGDIGEDAALDAALAHAGVAAEQVTWSKCKRDRDDGRLEYEVDFRAGGLEYEYTIDAASGTVLDFDRDAD